MDFIWYVLFSTLEGMSTLICMFCLFRFGIRRYELKIFIASLLFSLLSYALRVELNFEDFFPVVMLIMFWLFAYVIIKIPLFWSFVISVISNTFVFALQTVLLLLSIRTNLVSLEGVQSYQFDARILQGLSAFVTISLSLFLYKKGFGFSFTFDTFKLKSENTFMLSIVCVSFIILLVVFILQNLFYGAIVAALLFIYMLYLGVRKERTEL